MQVSVQHKVIPSSIILPEEKKTAFIQGITGPPLTKNTGENGDLTIKDVILMGIYSWFIIAKLFYNSTNYDWWYLKL